MARPRKYLTLEEWQKWLNNDWVHAIKKLSKHEGMLIAILALVVGVMAMVGVILSRLI